MNVDLGKSLINIIVSFRKDVDLHPLLFVDTLFIAEVDAPKILGIQFDRKLYLELYD